MTQALRQLLLLAGLLYAGKVWSCGIAWELPQNHFDGVDEQGYVSYWEKIGEIDLGDGLKLPLNINFCSHCQSSSPELGQGWILALLDSNLVQYDENHFAMCEPDGLLQRLKRDSSDPTLLKGGGWMAQISGDRITAWTECGWKLVFDHGKLVSMQTPKNEELDISYQDGKPKALLQNGTTPLLTVERDAQTGEATALNFGGKKVLISQDQRPMIEKMEGKNLIGAMGRSLHRLTLQDGSARSYDFAVDGMLTPTLKVSGIIDRVFTWDPTSNLITKDGDWTYAITPGSSSANNSEINRVNKLGQSEYWFYNGSHGQEITQGIDGIKFIKTWFTSGILTGKTREIDTIQSDGSKSICHLYYDENGRLFVKKYDDGRQVICDKAENPIQELQSGRSIYEVNTSAEQAGEENIDVKKNSVEYYSIKEGNNGYNINF